MWPRERTEDPQNWTCHVIITLIHCYNGHLLNVYSGILLGPGSLPHHRLCSLRSSSLWERHEITNAESQPWQRGSSSELRGERWGVDAGPGKSPAEGAAARAEARWQEVLRGVGGNERPSCREQGRVIWDGPGEAGRGRPGWDSIGHVKDSLVLIQMESIWKF